MAAFCLASAAAAPSTCDLERFLVHEEQDLAGLYHRAFGIDPLVQETVDPRLDVHLVRALGLSDIFDS